MTDTEVAETPVVTASKKASKKTSKAAKGKKSVVKAKGKKGAKPVLTEAARLWRNGYSRGYKGYPAPAKGSEPKDYMEGFAAGHVKGKSRKKPLP